MNMVARFQRKRWSRTRKLIDSLGPQRSLKLPRAEYYNAHSSVMRLNDAYGRYLTMRVRGATITVSRSRN